jgi:uncharacterized protein
MASVVTFGTASAASGTKAFGWLEICTMADGSPLRIPVHVIAGARPGPRMTVLSAQHGYEISEIEVCRRVIEMLDPQALKGTLVVVPIANPIAFESGTRCAWQDSLNGDNGNMNRVWPGKPDGWMTERTVWKINQELVQGTDILVDLHNGTTAPPGLTCGYGYAVVSDDKQLSDRNYAMSMTSGFELMVKRHVSTLGAHLAAIMLGQGILCFSCEVGEFYGFQVEKRDQPASQPVRTVPEVGVTALFNILKYMGMLEGEPVLPKRQLVISGRETNLRPSHGGALYSEFTVNAIGKVVPKNTLLGTVVNPYNFETLEEIRAPYSQTIILGVTHRHPFARVNMGDYGYLVMDMAAAEWVNH